MVLPNPNDDPDLVGPDFGNDLPPCGRTRVWIVVIERGSGHGRATVRVRAQSPDDACHMVYGVHCYPSSGDVVKHVYQED